MWLSALIQKLENAKALDPVVDTVVDLANRVLPSGAVKDLLHGKWLGHPLHPAMVALPIGTLLAVSHMDYAVRDRRAAQRLVGAGVVVMFPTALSGLADWSELGNSTRSKRVGLVHASGNILATLLYSASWWARQTGNHQRGRQLSLAGAAALGVGGYLGGHLAYSLGVGVNRNLDHQPEPGEWTDAAGVDQVVEGQLYRVEIADQPVVLTRVNGTPYALGAVCSHLGGPLEEGFVDGTSVVCPWHGSQFNCADGMVTRGPATVPQPAYDVRAVDGRLLVRARGIAR